MDEADRVHAAGYRRVSAAGKYQSRAHAFPTRALGAAIDDSADRPAGDHVPKGIPGDSLAARQWQRAGVAGISRATQNVPAALEFVQGPLFGKTWSDAGKNLRQPVHTQRRVRRGGGARRVRRTISEIPLRAHAVDPPHDRLRLEIPEGAAGGNPRRGHAAQVFPGTMGDSFAHDRQVGTGIWREAQSARQGAVEVRAYRIYPT